MAHNLSLALTIPSALNPNKLRFRIIGTWENPMFCVPDFCAVIGIENPRNVAARVAEADKITVRWVDGNRGNPLVTFVSEPAFYRILIRSDKPAAEPFSDWVMREVLPCIRKFGCYPASAKSKPDLLPYTNRVIETASVEMAVPEGYWCVFVEASSVLIRAEQVFAPAGLTMDVDDLLDGSVGIRYSKYREGKPWAGDRTRYAYRFPPPSKRSGITVNPLAYPMYELPYFREWLKWIYLPEHFPTYIRNKYGDGAFQLALPHLRRVLPAAIRPGSGG